MASALNFISDPIDLPDNSVLLQTGKHINKKVLLRSLAEAYKFPNYFGYNWDAAFDCIQDNPLNIAIDFRNITETNEKDLSDFIDIVVDSFNKNGYPTLWLITEINRSTDHPNITPTSDL